MLKAFTEKTHKLFKKFKILLNDTFSNKLTAIDIKMDEITPPAEVRGMKSLDREKFTMVKSIPTIMLHQSKLPPAVEILKKYFLKLENFRPLQPFPESYLTIYDLENIDTAKYKLAYLNPALIKNWNDFEPATITDLKGHDLLKEHFRYHDLQIKYENWKCEEILKAILPVDKEAVTGYSIIGHIVHVNLREHTFDYKSIIGEVLLDKVKNCKTVVNKLNQIDNTYRNFQVEVIAGEEEFVTSVKENKCTFVLDFSKVYWNTRLCTEHERIVTFINKGDILFDVFAGVGPFSVPAAKKKCKVFANDLNPESYKWLNHNAKLNKVANDNFKTFNIDGKIFIEEVFFNFLTDLLSKENVDYDHCIHITMNLPALAVTFVKSFVGKLNYDLKDKVEKLKITVYVYCFVSAESPKEAAQDLVEQNLGFKLTKDILKDVFYVRNVAPNKEMMRVTFYLTPGILLNSKKRKHSEICEN